MATNQTTKMNSPAPDMGDMTMGAHPNAMEPMDPSAATEYPDPAMAAMACHPHSGGHVPMSVLPSGQMI